MTTPRSDKAFAPQSGSFYVKPGVLYGEGASTADTQVTLDFINLEPGSSIAVLKDWDTNTSQEVDVLSEHNIIADETLTDSIPFLLTSRRGGGFSSIQVTAGKGCGLIINTLPTKA